MISGLYCTYRLFSPAKMRRFCDVSVHCIVSFLAFLLQLLNKLEMIVRNYPGEPHIAAATWPFAYLFHVHCNQCAWSRLSVLEVTSLQTFFCCRPNCLELTAR